MMTLDFKGEQVLHTVDFSFMIIDCNKPALEILYFNKSDRHVWILCDLQLLYTLCLRELFFYLLVGKCYCCLFLFTPVTCTMFGNFWQFFFIVSLHNLGSLKVFANVFSAFQLVVCLLDGLFDVFFSEIFIIYYSKVFLGITDLSSVTIDRCWVGWGGGGAEVRKGQQLG